MHLVMNLSSSTQGEEVLPLVKSQGPPTIRCAQASNTFILILYHTTGQTDRVRGNNLPVKNEILRESGY